MAAAQGYIGRNPADSSTVIARQSFSPTGIQTDFTFAAGYEIGYVDLYLNGARLVEGQDFSATDGSTVGLTTNAVNGDVLEVVAFKAFNATSVSAAAGNFTVGGTLDVTGATSIGGNTTVGTGITLDTNGNVNVSGVLTAGSFYGDGTNLTGVGGGSVISGITIREEGSTVGTAGTVVNINFVGPDVTAIAQAGFSTITIAGGGKFINFTDGESTGVTTTAKTKIQNDFNVTGVSTFSGPISVGDTISLGDHDRLRFGADNDLQIYHDGSDSYVQDSRNNGRLRLSADIFQVIDKDATEQMLKATVDGAVELNYNGSKKFETTNNGTITVGVGTFDGLSLGDNEKALFGAGNDLEIYHDESNSVIKDNGTGKLILDTDGTAIEFQKQGLETIATFNTDGAVELYHDNSKKFETTSSGVNITGIATASQFDATSDVSLKENIEVIDEPITKLSELKGVTFDWKAGGHSVGVIAQDVEKVLPTAVGGNKDQKTVNYNAIIGLLVESVKDQQKQIEELKSLLDK